MAEHDLPQRSTPRSYWALSVLPHLVLFGALMALWEGLSIINVIDSIMVPRRSLYAYRLADSRCDAHGD